MTTKQTKIKTKRNVKNSTVLQKITLFVSLTKSNNTKTSYNYVIIS